MHGEGNAERSNFATLHPTILVLVGWVCINDSHFVDHLEHEKKVRAKRTGGKGGDSE